MIFFLPPQVLILTADYNNRILSPSDRYQNCWIKNQWIIKRMAVYGLHVHIGMLNADECIKFNNYLIQFLPHLIALSASSFWRVMIPDWMQSRPTTYEAHPTAGMPILVEDWPNFLFFIINCYRPIPSKVWRMFGGFWTQSRIWNTRNSICDAPATILEVESITAFYPFIGISLQKELRKPKSENHALPTSWILRENKWRAIRSGVDAEIIKESSLQIISIKKDVIQLLDSMEDLIQEFGYQKYKQCILNILEKRKQCC